METKPMTKSKFQKEMEQMVSEYKGNALRNNYIIGYSVRIQATDPTDDDFETWRKMTISRVQFEKVGFAGLLEKQTMRLKIPAKTDRSKITGRELVKLIENSPKMLMVNNPNEIIEEEAKVKEEAKEEAKKETE